MKDKLRELAGRWSVKDPVCDSGVIATTFKQCADELLTILDAEGDGGAVGGDVLAVGVRARNIEITRQQRAGEPNNEDHALRIGIAAALATHPARSGVVRDEDVRDAERYRWLRKRVGVSASYGFTNAYIPCGNSRITEADAASTDQAIDAAIQGERHDR